MSDVRKVPASAGAEWLMGGIALLRKAPLGLGVLGALYGLFSLVVGLSAQHNMSLFLLLELVALILGPILIGGMIYAAREVDRDSPAVPGHLLQGIRDGKTARLWATLLPQIGAAVLIVLLLVILVGPSELTKLVATVEKLQGQVKPDPSLFAGFPAGRLFLWLLLSLVIGILASFFTFIGVPEIMLTDSSAMAAMGRSFRACLQNLPALIVFFIVTIIGVLALSFVLGLVSLLIRVVGGEMLAQAIMQLLMMAVLLPVITGAMYIAWKQMLGATTATTTPATPATSGTSATSEFEA